MQDAHGPASPVIEQPIMTIPPLELMQLCRLTDSHCGTGNPHRGFEIMKMRGRCSGRTQHESAPWRLVNPEAEASVVRPVLSGVVAGGDAAMAREDFRKTALKNP